MEKVPGVMFTTINTKSGKREIVFEPKRKRISEDGLSVQQAALALRSSVDGLVTTTFKSGGEEFDIRVKLEGGAVSDINDLRNIPIAASRGIFPLSRYADIGFEKSYNMVLRTNKARTVEVTAELLPGYAQGCFCEGGWEHGDFEQAVEEAALGTRRKASRFAACPYVSRILRKIGLRSRTELAAYAIQNGFSFSLSEIPGRDPPSTRR